MSYFRYAIDGNFEIIKKDNIVEGFVNRPIIRSGS